MAFRTISNAERSELDALIRGERRDVRGNPESAKPAPLKPVVAPTRSEKLMLLSTSRHRTSIGDTEIPKTHGSAPLPERPDEAAVVATAIRQLNGGAPADALATLETYWMQHPGGELAPEAEMTGIDALLRMHRTDEALTRLDAMPLDGQPNGTRLALIRGELRAEKDRCREAVADFSLVIGSADRSVSSRAQYDRGVCRARLGDASGARDDLHSYLASEPNGTRADSARRALLRL